MLHHLLKKFPLVIAVTTLMSSPLSAHLMVAQHGTVRVVGDGAFMVLSVPVSAFDGVDDDTDGKLSKVEFTRHRPAIAAVIHQNLGLIDQSGTRRLQGMMMSLGAPHEASSEPTEQLIIMGRFVLSDSLGELGLHLNLFGKGPERLYSITSTRVADGLKHKFELTPEQPEAGLFSRSTED